MIEEVKDLEWSFSGTDTPNVRYGESRSYSSVDPTPAYTHDPKLVAKALRETRRAAGRYLKVDVRVCIFHYETTGRTNGWAERGQVWNYDKEQWDKEPLIGLMGKRIPIHPAMTRYLVPHEYGHHVEYLLQDKFGHKDYDNTVINAYAEARKMDQAKYYGPGQWHLHPKEVFANDFRTVVVGAETEFWPHEVPMLTKRSKLWKWWERLRTTKPAEWKLP